MSYRELEQLLQLDESLIGQPISAHLWHDECTDLPSPADLPPPVSVSASYPYPPEVQESINNVTHNLIHGYFPEVDLAYTVVDATIHLYSPRPLAPSVVLTVSTPDASVITHACVARARAASFVSGRVSHVLHLCTADYVYLYAYAPTPAPALEYSLRAPTNGTTFTCSAVSGARVFLGGSSAYVSEVSYGRGLVGQVARPREQGTQFLTGLATAVQRIARRRRTTVVDMCVVPSPLGPLVAVLTSTSRIAVFALAPGKKFVRIGHNSNLLGHCKQSLSLTNQSGVYFASISPAPSVTPTIVALLSTGARAYITIQTFPAADPAAARPAPTPARVATAASLALAAVRQRPYDAEISAAICSPAPSPHLTRRQAAPLVTPGIVIAPVNEGTSAGLVIAVTNPSAYGATDAKVSATLTPPDNLNNNNNNNAVAAGAVADGANSLPAYTEETARLALTNATVYGVYETTLAATLQGSPLGPVVGQREFVLFTASSVVTLRAPPIRERIAYFIAQQSTVLTSPSAVFDAVSTRFNLGTVETAAMLAAVASAAAPGANGGLAHPQMADALLQERAFVNNAAFNAAVGTVCAPNAALRVLIDAARRGAEASEAVRRGLLLHIARTLRTIWQLPLFASHRVRGLDVMYSQPGTMAALARAEQVLIGTKSALLFELRAALGSKGALPLSITNITLQVLFAMRRVGAGVSTAAIALTLVGERAQNAVLMGLGRNGEVTSTATPEFARDAAALAAYTSAAELARACADAATAPRRSLILALVDWFNSRTFIRTSMTHPAEVIAPYLRLTLAQVVTQPADTQTFKRLLALYAALPAICRLPADGDDTHTIAALETNCDQLFDGAASVRARAMHDLTAEHAPAGNALFETNVGDRRKIAQEVFDRLRTSVTTSTNPASIIMPALPLAHAFIDCGRPDLAAGIYALLAGVFAGTQEELERIKEECLMIIRRYCIDCQGTIEDAFRVFDCASSAALFAGVDSLITVSPDAPNAQLAPVSLLAPMMTPATTTSAPVTSVVERTEQWDAMVTAYTLNGNSKSVVTRSKHNSVRRYLAQNDPQLLTRLLRESATNASPDDRNKDAQLLLSMARGNVSFTDRAEMLQAAAAAAASGAIKKEVAQAADINRIQGMFAGDMTRHEVLLSPAALAEQVRDRPDLLLALTPYLENTATTTAQLWRQLAEGAGNDKIEKVLRAAANMPVIMPRDAAVIAAILVQATTLDQVNGFANRVIDTALTTDHPAQFVMDIIGGLTACLGGGAATTLARLTVQTAAAAAATIDQQNELIILMVDRIIRLVKSKRLTLAFNDPLVLLAGSDQIRGAIAILAAAATAAAPQLLPMIEELKTIK